MNRRRLLLTGLTALVLAIAGYSALRSQFPPVQGWTMRAEPEPVFDTLDPWLKRAFLNSASPVTGRYADLFRYLLAGLLAYRDPHASRAHYPGFPSSHGRDIDGLEGFSRMAPLIAAWLAGGRAERVQVPEFGEIDLPDLLAKGFQAGTDPASTGYWGDIGRLDQRLVEAADIALAVWLTRDTVWPRLDRATRRQLVDWLAQAQGKADGARFANWHLFPMLVDRALRSLGEPGSGAAFAADWSLVASSHAGGGWFRDSEDVPFDYYNAWSFHYALYWLAQMDDAFERGDRGFLTGARRSFVALYRHLATPRGFPVLGRSICYRTAMPVPLLVGALTQPVTVAPGEARRALDLTWRYFVEHGALDAGVLTQGYCGADPRILERYAGPASCLWGTRSLVVALAQPDHAPLWTAAEQPLAVELGDFAINDTRLGWRIEGDRDRGTVVIRVAGNDADPALMRYGFKHKIASMLLHRPFLPGNRRAKYERSVYRSDQPFCGCLTTGQ